MIKHKFSTTKFFNIFAQKLRVSMKNSLKEIDFSNTEKVPELLNQYMPHLSIDCVIIGFHNNELKVLLSKYPKLDVWALQGGFVKKAEDIDAAAIRILEEMTGLSNIYLKQFHTFGKAHRPMFSESFKESLGEVPFDMQNIPFLQQRFVSIGYYSLVDFPKVTPSVPYFFEHSEWHDIQNLPNLAFDHAEIIAHAIETMRHSLDYHLVGFNLLPDTFTMKDLQNLYETILGEPLRRNNFQEKMLNLGILERLEKQFTGKAHKAPYLYRFKKS
jgi:8-oxo-dGTP diphosphatase